MRVMHREVGIGFGTRSGSCAVYEGGSLGVGMQHGLETARSGQTGTVGDGHVVWARVAIVQMCVMEQMEALQALLWPTVVSQCLFTQTRQCTSHQR
jgi:hypothetical protein